MKKYLLSCLGCLIILVGFSKYTYCAESLPLPPEIDVYSIKFDYESGYTNDALNIRVNYTTDVQVPEWQNSPFRNNKFAYIKNQTNRKVKVKFYDNNGDINNMRVYANGGGQHIGNLTQTYVTFGSNNYSNEVTMTFNGSVPSSVGDRYFYLLWYVNQLNGSFCEPTYIYDSGNHEYYTLLSVPQSPMDEPWTVVLEYACNWASGKSNEADAVKMITEKAYTDMGRVYDGTRDHEDFPTFHLTGFLNDNWADCQDMSAVVQLFSQAVGGSTTEVRKIWGLFAVKKILPLGTTDWDEYEYEIWTFHQVGYRSNVYDACIKLKNPERIPTNEAINTTYKEDLFDEGSWSPENTKKFTNID